ncbi:MAG TPA: hypothetical protein VEI02_03675, partial [Planctomycetota bacterium]|nr:hypothetical protein [Planctomycetota bacterium]
MAENEIAALLDLLDDENRGVAAAARGRLISIGDRALPALEGAAGGDEARRRVRARRAVDEILSAGAERAFADRLSAGEIDLEEAALGL